MDNKKSKIKAQLDAIRVSYITSLEEKRVSIKGYWLQLNDDWTVDTFDSLYLVIHGLAGSAETFGFPEITQQARIVVNHFKELDPHHPPENGSLLEQIELDIDTLLSTLHQTAQA